MTNIPWKFKRWILISIAVCVEAMSCLSSKIWQPWSTISGCLLMFIVVYLMSCDFKPFKKQQ